MVRDGKTLLWDFSSHKSSTKRRAGRKHELYAHMHDKCTPKIRMKVAVT